jgi:hypothetical protein
VILRGELQSYLIKPFGSFVFPSAPVESKLSKGLLAPLVIPWGELQSYLIKPFGSFVFPSAPVESKLSPVLW